MRSTKQTTKETANQRLEREWKSFLREAGRHSITRRQPKPVKTASVSYEGKPLTFSIGPGLATALSDFD